MGVGLVGTLVGFYLLDDASGVRMQLVTAQHGALAQVGWTF